MIRLHSVALS